MRERRKVFIVENDPTFRYKLVDSIARMDDAETFTFTSVEECLSVIECEPEVIIADDTMDSKFKEVMSGIGLLAYCQEHFPELDVIITTKDIGSLRQNKLVQDHAFDCIEKSEENLDRINTMLHIIFRHHALKENAAKYRNSLYFAAASCLTLVMGVGMFVNM